MESLGFNASFSSNPAVSINSTQRGPTPHTALIQSRVVPLMFVTIAFCLPAKQFSRVLLPLLGGPAMTSVQP
jgi:hypothetical protein